MDILSIDIQLFSDLESKLLTEILLYFLSPYLKIPSFVFKYV